MLHQNKDWLYQKYFTENKTQLEIANEIGLKQVTICKWLNIHFTKKELKSNWHYGNPRPDLSGELHWTKKHPEHPFNERLKEGLGKGRKQSEKEIEKRKKAIKKRNYKHSQETKLKLSLSKKGDKNPQTKMRGEISPFWKKEKTKEERLKDRKYNQYHEWRKNVYERDNYECRKCGVNNKTLNSHHIINYSDNKEKRLDINNGITLCKNCHSEFHKIYGRNNNTLEQINEYLQN